MTKRAGKRKSRMGQHRHPPVKTDDGKERLPEDEARALELRAISNKWLVSDDPGFQRLREQLIRKLVEDAVLTNDAEVRTRITRTIAQIEQRERHLNIVRDRHHKLAELPEQKQPEPDDAPRASPREVAAELLRNARIQATIDFSPNGPDDSHTRPAIPPTA